MDYYLDDVEAQAKANPDTFFIPVLEDRMGQKIEDLVRLHFVLTDPGPDDPGAERMWVEIFEKQDGGKRYKGYLTNMPYAIQSLSPGDVIEFEPKHIAQVIYKKDHPKWIDSAGKRAFVSEMCFVGDFTVRFMYREEPDNEEDSGWRMMNGQESDEYTSNPENIRLPNVGWLLDKDPSLLFPLKNGKPGDAYERAAKNTEWIKIDDWP